MPVASAHSKASAPARRSFRRSEEAERARARKAALWLLAGLLAGCAGPAPDVPEHRSPPNLNASQWDAFRRHTTWKPNPAAVDGHAPTPLRRAVTSALVGDVLVVEGDSSVVSTASNTPRGSGYGIRMDEARRDVAHITQHVIEEQGDRFDFIVVFPTFEDLYNPGLAYYASITNMDSGFGVGTLTLAQNFGSAGRLQGFINMNRPRAYTALDGLPLSHPDSAAQAIMGQEMGHRWLAFARFQQVGFNNNLPSPIMLGRDQAHWSALMHTGPADPDAPLFVSVEDGNAWRDNGNGTFTAVEVYGDPAAQNITTRARYSPLDLYLMGLMRPDEVDPFFVITNARLGNQFVPANARLTRGTTVTGTRHDVAVEDVVAALGSRVPDAAGSPKDFNVAMVVLTAPGERVGDVLDTVAQVDGFRVQWEERFHEWTRGRASVCTSLSGQCNRTTLALEDVAVEETQSPGSWAPGETLTVRASVHNLGGLPSQLASVSVTPSDARVRVLPGARNVGVLAPGMAVPVAFEVQLPADLPCGNRLGITLTLAASGAPLTTARVENAVGLATQMMADLTSTSLVAPNAQATDTATAGAWRVGTPQRTDLRNYNHPQVYVQPGDIPPGEPAGTVALMTDPGAAGMDPGSAEETDVDDGVATVDIGPLETGGLSRVTLSYWAWHTAVALDGFNARIVETAGDDLVVSVGTSAAGPFVEVDRLSDSPYAWQFRQVDVGGGVVAPAGAPLWVRLSVQDAGDEQNFVEAAVASLALGGRLPVCGVASSGSSRGSGGASGGQGGSSSTGSGVPSQGAPQPPGGGGAQLGCACASVQGAPEAWIGVTALLGMRMARQRRRGGA